MNTPRQFDPVDLAQLKPFSHSAPDAAFVTEESLKPSAPDAGMTPTMDGGPSPDSYMGADAGATHRSLERGLALLALIANATGPLTLAQVSARMKWPSSTAHHMMQMLVRTGYLSQDGQTRAYSPTQRLFRVTGGTAPAPVKLPAGVSADRRMGPFYNEIKAMAARQGLQAFLVLSPNQPERTLSVIFQPTGSTAVWVAEQTAPGSDHASVSNNPPLRQQSIYGSTEMDAISRGFRFTEYLDFHKKCGEQGGAVDEQLYADLGAAFHDSMIRDFVASRGTSEFWVNEAAEITPEQWNSIRPARATDEQWNGSLRIMGLRELVSEEIAKEKHGKIFPLNWALVQEFMERAFKDMDDGLPAPEVFPVKQAELAAKFPGSPLPDEAWQKGAQMIGHFDERSADERLAEAFPLSHELIKARTASAPEGVTKEEEERWDAMDREATQRRLGLRADPAPEPAPSDVLLSLASGLTKLSPISDQDEQHPGAETL